MNQLYNKKRFRSEVEKDLNKENYKKKMIIKIIVSIYNWNNMYV